MRPIIGIVGYGMVGETVHAGFPTADARIVDPLKSPTKLIDICIPEVSAIFVCVPTPATEPTHATLTSTLDQIFATGYRGLVVVKSTALPQFLTQFDVVYNPEFLSRATALDDFISPPYVVVGGNRSAELIELYREHTDMDLTNTYIVDIPTASFIKYASNTLFAVKVTYMNELHRVAKMIGADYAQATSIMKTNPVIGTGHMDVPGPDGQYGYGGPCLPKDAETLAWHFNAELLSKAIELNAKYRA